jgi:hypothetical protein
MGRSGATRKVTVVLPRDLLDRAMRATGKGVSATVRIGLELVAARDVCKGLLKWRGRYNPTVSIEELREDR